MSSAAFLDGHAHLVINISKVSSIIKKSGYSTQLIRLQHSANSIPVGHSFYEQFTRLFCFSEVGLACETTYSPGPSQV